MFGKPKAVIYLRRSSLELYTDKSQSYVEKLQIPAQLESSEEVLDQEGLGRFLNDFFTKVTFPKQKALIILSDEVTFSKVSSLGKITQEELETLRRQFFESIPVDLHVLSKLEVIYKDKFYLVACNKKLYEAILKSLSGLGREVEFVVPAFIFGVSPNGSLTGADIHKILLGRELVKMSNLLTAKVSSSWDDTLGEPISPMKRKSDLAVFDLKYFFIPAFVIVVVLVVVGGLIFLSDQKKTNFSFTSFKTFFGGAVSKPSPTLLPFPISTGSADFQNQKLSDKGQMAVEVINGTGKAGQAGKVKTMLENLGFDNITTGNAQISNNTVTKVEFASNVASDVISELEKELSTTFEKVESSEQSSASDYKIIITTGPESSP
jgi:hypothetical protein